MADKENKLAPDTEEGEEKNGMGKRKHPPPTTPHPPTHTHAHKINRNTVEVTLPRSQFLKVTSMTKPRMEPLLCTEPDKCLDTDTTDDDDDDDNDVLSPSERVTCCLMGAESV